MGTLYKYIENVRPGDGFTRLEFPGGEGKPTVVLEKGGPAAELTVAQRDQAMRDVVLEPATEEDLPKPEGVPEDYDDLKVDQVVMLLEGSSPDAVKAIKKYEKNHSERKTVLEWEPTPDEGSEA